MNGRSVDFVVPSNRIIVVKMIRIGDVKFKVNSELQSVGLAFIRFRSLEMKYSIRALYLVTKTACDSVEHGFL